MSTFEVKARRVEVLPHENADALEIARVDGYRCVVAKDSFRTGDVAVYLPEQAVLPGEVISKLGLDGKLAGRDKNRVKAVRLRGVLSQGLLYRPDGLDLQEGVDYAETLGVTKWVPAVPASMDGAVYPCPEIEPYTELENIKRFPDAFSDGDNVIMCEKLHGSCLIATYDVDSGTLHVSSKGLAKKGLALEPTLNASGEHTNVYWQVAQRYELRARAAEMVRLFSGSPLQTRVSTLTFYGELLGVQDLMYGLEKGAHELRLFDLRIDGRFQWLPAAHSLLEASNRYGATKFPTAPSLEMVPLIYAGQFSHEQLRAATNGTETLTGNESHIREGVVVRSAHERDHDDLGRLILKSVSDDYLTRHGGTEYE